MDEIMELKKWVNSLGPNWNLFGDVDKAKYMIEKIEQRLEAVPHETIVMRYSIETLEIELNKVKSTIRLLDIMQDEMFQNHPSIDSYRSKKDELESSIEILKNA